MSSYNLQAIAEDYFDTLDLKKGSSFEFTAAYDRGLYIPGGAERQLFLDDFYTLAKFDRIIHPNHIKNLNRCIEVKLENENFDKAFRAFTFLANKYFEGEEICSYFVKNNMERDNMESHTLKKTKKAITCDIEKFEFAFVGKGGHIYVREHKFEHSFGPNNEFNPLSFKKVKSSGDLYGEVGYLISHGIFGNKESVINYVKNIDMAIDYSNHS